MGASWVPEMVVGRGGGGGFVSSSQGKLHLWTRYIDGLLGHTKTLETQFAGRCKEITKCVVFE